MTYAALLIHTAKVFNRSDTLNDIYGNSVPAFDSGTEYPCRFDPATPGNPGRTLSREYLDDRDTAITDYNVFFETGTPIARTTELEWEGRRLRVVGEPAFFSDSTGVHHIECRAEWIEG